MFQYNLCNEIWFTNSFHDFFNHPIAAIKQGSYRITPPIYLVFILKMAWLLI